jgi:hypothetical protein
MKLLTCIALLFAACTFADEAADRKAIREVISSLNQPRDSDSAIPVARLFTSDADSADVARLTRLVQQLDEARRPWSELSSPQIGLGAIRFVTPDVALVAAQSARYGTVVPGRPLLFVMKKVGADWRIFSFP